MIKRYGNRTVPRLSQVVAADGTATVTITNTDQFSWHVKTMNINATAGNGVCTLYKGDVLPQFFHSLSRHPAADSWSEGVADELLLKPNGSLNFAFSGMTPGAKCWAGVTVEWVEEVNDNPDQTISDYGA